MEDNTKVKNKIVRLVIGFMLLFPFRLPISILMIKAFNWIIGLTSESIPTHVLCSNVIITKLVYNIAIGAWFVYTVEKLSCQIKGRRAKQYTSSPPEGDAMYWWSGMIIFMLFCFAIADAVSTYQMFYK